MIMEGAEKQINHIANGFALLMLQTNYTFAF